jgi:stearoyl-CoA desaturase (delta-9 desaturase)
VLIGGEFTTIITPIHIGEARQQVVGADIGWLIRLMEMVRLASVKKVAPKTSFAAEFDRHRHASRDRQPLPHVLKLYGCRVIAPVLYKHADGEQIPRKQLSRIRKLMVRREEGSDPNARQWLETALQRNQTLRTVYDFKQQLAALWGNGKSDTDRLTRLQAWCAEAEASGIRVLRLRRQLHVHRHAQTA